MQEGINPNAVRTHACMRIGPQRDSSGDGLAQGKNSHHPYSCMAPRGRRTARGGRSEASRNSSLEGQLAETADYFLRIVLGEPPRPHWGPLWQLPASRAELVAYLQVVAGSPEVDPDTGAE